MIFFKSVISVLPYLPPFKIFTSTSFFLEKKCHRDIKIPTRFWYTGLSHNQNYLYDYNERMKICWDSHNIINGITLNNKDISNKIVLRSLMLMHVWCIFCLKLRFILISGWDWRYFPVCLLFKRKLSSCWIMACFTRLFGDLRKRKLTFTEKLSFWPKIRKWPNLAQCFRKWHKINQIGENGGERKIFPSANPDMCSVRP